MGREIQKKKRRSQRQPVRQPNRPKRPLNPLGNSTIAQNWDKNETLAQNYRRLGLAARLRAPTGGTEKLLSSSAARAPSKAAAKDPFAIEPTPKSIITEARVERDADGKIIRVIGSGAQQKPNPLNDPLNALDSDSEDGEEAEEKTYEEWGGIQENGDETGVVRTLMDEARRPAEKKPRYQSEREREWLARLVDKYGDDTRAMARDRKLNPMQQTAADISRRIKKMKKA